MPSRSGPRLALALTDWAPKKQHRDAQPLLNDYEGADGPFNEATLKGNPTGLDITATAWEFLRAFDKDDVATA